MILRKLGKLSDLWWIFVVQVRPTNITGGPFLHVAHSCIEWLVERKFKATHGLVTWGNMIEGGNDMLAFLWCPSVVTTPISTHQCHKLWMSNSEIRRHPIMMIDCRVWVSLDLRNKKWSPPIGSMYRIYTRILGISWVNVGTLLGALGRDSSSMSIVGSNLPRVDWHMHVSIDYRQFQCMHRR